jgi:hypothetical protein
MSYFVLLENCIKRRRMYTVCYISYTYISSFIKLNNSFTFYIYRKPVSLKIITCYFRNFRYIHTEITMKLFFQCFCILRTLHKPIYMSVYRTITVSVQSVWPIVLHGRILFRISLHCNNATQLFPQISTMNRQSYFLIFLYFFNFPTFVGIVVFKRTLGYPQFL